MLEQRDLEVLQKMMESVVDKRIEESERRIDVRLAETESRMEERLAETESRMEERLAETESRMEERLAETERRMEIRIDESEKRTQARIDESEKKMAGTMDKKIAEAVNAILEELDRTQTNLERKIYVVKHRMEEISQYYEITKLENDNTTSLMRLIEDLTKRVEELERKTA